MKNLPKISIVIPSLNKVKFVGDTLHSIVAQEYPNLEVIVRDGGSTDGTVKIIKKYAAKYPEIFIWESKKDKGQLDAINKGLKKATGNVLAFINADDIYKRKALMRVGEYFAKHPKILWLAGRGDTIDEKGNNITPFVTKYKNYLLGLDNYPALLMTNYLMQPSVFLSRKAYKKYSPFTGTKTSVMEYDLWLKIGKEKMPTVINQYVSSFRVSKSSKSFTLFRSILKEDDKIVGKYTTNPVTLGLHYLHNIGRIMVAFFLNQE